MPRVLTPEQKARKVDRQRARIVADPVAHAARRHDYYVRNFERIAERVRAAQGTRTQKPLSAEAREKKAEREHVRYLKNKAAHIAQQKVWRTVNAASIAERARVYYVVNREAINERIRAQRAAKKADTCKS